MHDAHPKISTTAEGGGFVQTCLACQWIRFYAGRSEAESGRVEHVKKCKGPKVAKTEAAPRAARSTGWADREGATWIDQL
jgi:hypothetical protein